MSSSNPLKTVTLKRVTIIAEAVVERQLLEELSELGASGYTVVKAEGRGSRGVRASDWEGRNIKVETIVRPAVAEKILDRLAKYYFTHFAVIAYVDEVEVVRGEKYASPHS